MQDINCHHLKYLLLFSRCRKNYLTQNWIYIRRCKLEKKSLNLGESIPNYSWRYVS